MGSKTTEYKLCTKIKWDGIEEDCKTTLESENVFDEASAALFYKTLSRSFLVSTPRQRLHLSTTGNIDKFRSLSLL